MRGLNNKLKTGKKLRRVREIHELVARQRVAQANANVRLSLVEEEQRRGELQSYDDELHGEACEGMSMRHFMHRQGLRDMHRAAVRRAEGQRQTATVQANQKQQRLMEATTERRTAERLVSLISARRALAFRRLEQKATDDMTCARFGQGGYDDAA